MNYRLLCLLLRGHAATSFSYWTYWCQTIYESSVFSKFWHSFCPLSVSNTDNFYAHYILRSVKYATQHSNVDTTPDVKKYEYQYSTISIQNWKSECVDKWVVQLSVNSEYESSYSSLFSRNAALRRKNRVTFICSLYCSSLYNCCINLRLSYRSIIGSNLMSMYILRDW